MSVTCNACLYGFKLSNMIYSSYLHDKYVGLQNLQAPATIATVLIAVIHEIIAIRISSQLLQCLIL